MSLLESMACFLTCLICVPCIGGLQQSQQEIRHEDPRRRLQEQQPLLRDEEPIRPYYISVQPSTKSQLLSRPRAATGPLQQFGQNQVNLQNEPIRPYYISVQPSTKFQLLSRPRAATGPTRQFGRNRVNLQNEYYKSLRDRAIEEGGAAAKCSRESRRAHAAGRRLLAQELSDKRKQHKAEEERLNKEASEWIFAENNKVCGHDEVDLHGLYVQEAITFTERSIAEACARGSSELRLIVGKGLHSRKDAKIKPAIEGLIRMYDLAVEVDPSNAGVLVVSLDRPVIMPRAIRRLRG